MNGQIRKRIGSLVPLGSVLIPDPYGSWFPPLKREPLPTSSFTGGVGSVGTLGFSTQVPSPRSTKNCLPHTLRLEIRMSRPFGQESGVGEPELRPRRPKLDIPKPPNVHIPSRLRKNRQWRNRLNWKDQMR